MSVAVREARQHDLPSLAEVAAITFPLACPPHTTEEAKSVFIAEVLSEARFGEYLADSQHSVLVAVDEAGSVIGYTMLIHGEPHDPDVVAAIRIRPTVELSKCYVLPGHHGAGVASALMAASLEHGRARGAAGVWLGVNQENARAQRFYAKNGFERVGVKHFMVGDRLEDDFVFERPL